MISDELLAELKQILWEEYEINLPEKDLVLFAQSLKGMFSSLVQALSDKPEYVQSLIEEKKFTNNNI